MFATQPDPAWEIREAVIDEIINSIGLPCSGWPRRLLARGVRTVASQFATLLAAADQDIDHYGFREAVRRLLPHFVQSCWQSGAESIPTAGPLLVASNHPGATDALVIAASLPRDDLKIVVSDVPLTRALCHGQGHFVYAPEDLGERAHAVREMIRHLRSGGAVLIFPGHYLDPDPAFLPGAEDRLAAWSRSVTLILRHIPAAQLVIAIVGGVLEPRCASHPLTWLAPKGWERQKLAETIQLAQQVLSESRYALHPKVTFGAPIASAALYAGHSGSRDVMPAIIDGARQVLALHRSAESRAIAVPLPASGARQAGREPQGRT